MILSSQKNLGSEYEEIIRQFSKTISYLDVCFWEVEIMLLTDLKQEKFSMI